MNERIFVQIAAYRDPELLPTLADCLTRASDPRRLRFGLCWQRDDTETLGDYAGDSRFRVVAVEYRRSRGTCWARHRLQELYSGETYTLQLDSHHRFVDGWDDCLIAMLREVQRGSAKAVLTSYAPPYVADQEPGGRGVVPLRIRFRRFSREGPVEVRSEAMDDFESLSAPIPARFFSAHFAFSLGRFSLDVPHDPKLYFFGEEPTLAARAFTHGYDLFHPHRVVLWHRYGRGESAKHWTDHPLWYYHHQRSIQRTRQLLGIDGTPRDIDFGRYGLGTERSLDAFQAYAGIHYGLRGVSDYTLSNGTPPEPGRQADETPGAESFVRSQAFRVRLAPEQIPSTSHDFDFWYVGAHSEDGVELFRIDLRGAELESMLRDEPHGREFSFHTTQFIDTWTVWPHSASRGWLTKITGSVAENAPARDEKRFD